MGRVPSQYMADEGVELVVLGIAQDGGVPQAGCFCKRCFVAINDPSKSLYPTSCIIRGLDGSFHLIEATRSLPHQLGIAARGLGVQTAITPDSVCLTHSHLGHIDGLGQFGKEVMGLDGIPLFASSSVIGVLEERSLSSPFRTNEVIAGNTFSPSLGCGFEYEFIQVPHRDEHSDTHAIVIRGPKSALLFLPDHDDWGQTLSMVGENSIMSWLQKLEIEFALIDGTFWSSDELGGRDIAQVPHPTISESLTLLRSKEEGDPEVAFIHLNHTNPALDPDSKQCMEVSSLGWSIGKQGSVFEL